MVESAWLRYEASLRSPHSAGAGGSLLGVSEERRGSRHGDNQLGRPPPSPRAAWGHLSPDLEAQRNRLKPIFLLQATVSNRRRLARGQSDVG